MTMEDRRRDIEVGITPDADDLLRRIEATVEPQKEDVEIDELFGLLTDHLDITDARKTVYDFRMHGFMNSSKSSVVVNDGVVESFTLRLPIPPTGISEPEVREGLEESVEESNPPYELDGLRWFIGSGFTPHVTNLYGESEPRKFIRWVRRLIGELRDRVGFERKYDVYVETEGGLPGGAETGIAQMECGELLDRTLDLRNVATDFPQKGVISMRLKQEFQRAGKRLNFAAKEADCLSQPEYNQLNRTVDLLSSTLGEDEVFDVAQRYERQARNAFEGSVAGIGPG